MNCKFDVGLVCMRCGYKASSPKVKRMCPSAGLGDVVEAVLETAGITKERVSKVASVVGVKDCGCKKRQQWLNEIGKMVGLGLGPNDSDHSA